MKHEKVFFFFNLTKVKSTEKMALFKNQQLKIPSMAILLFNTIVVNK